MWTGADADCLSISGRGFFRPPRTALRCFAGSYSIPAAGFFDAERRPARRRHQIVSSSEACFLAAERSDHLATGRCQPR
jgi:hypothetical protein